MIWRSAHDVSLPGTQFYSNWNQCWSTELVVLKKYFTVMSLFENNIFGSNIDIHEFQTACHDGRHCWIKSYFENLVVISSFFPDLATFSSFVILRLFWTHRALFVSLLNLRFLFAKTRGTQEKGKGIGYSTRIPTILKLGKLNLRPLDSIVTTW